MQGKIVLTWNQKFSPEKGSFLTEHLGFSQPNHYRITKSSFETLDNRRQSIRPNKWANIYCAPREIRNIF